MASGIWPTTGGAVPRTRRHGAPYPSASHPDDEGEGRMDGTLYDWAQDAAARLDVPEDGRWVADKETVQWVLDFSRDVAQGVARPGAPVGAFLAGIAVGRRLDDGPQALEDVRTAIEPTLNPDRA